MTTVPQDTSHAVEARQSRGRLAELDQKLQPTLLHNYEDFGLGTESLLFLSNRSEAPRNVNRAWGLKPALLHPDDSSASRASVPNLDRDRSASSLRACSSTLLVPFAALSCLSWNFYVWLQAPQVWFAFLKNRTASLLHHSSIHLLDRRSLY